MDRAPAVRARRLADELAALGEVETLWGDSSKRRAAVARLAHPAAWSKIDAVYVELPSSTPALADLLLLLLARAHRRPVGIYIRDAYQRFRHLYPRTRRRQWLGDAWWRVTTAIAVRCATTVFVPSTGLGQVLGLDQAVALPPGTDPHLPDLGAASGALVAYVGATNPADGFPLLLEAMRRLRESVPAAGLKVVSPTDPTRGGPTLPPWATWSRISRDALPDALRDARLCVVPRPSNAYTDLAVPIKLLDYLAMGKPVVLTEASESQALVEPDGAALVSPATVDALAATMRRVIDDDRLAITLSRRARALALRPGSRWSDRAQLLHQCLLHPAPPAPKTQAPR